MTFISNLKLRISYILRRFLFPWDKGANLGENICSKDIKREMLNFGSNLVPRVFSLFNMAAAREKTLAHSALKRSLIGAILT